MIFYLKAPYISSRESLYAVNIFPTTKVGHFAQFKTANLQMKVQEKWTKKRQHKQGESLIGESFISYHRLWMIDDWTIPANSFSKLAAYHLSACFHLYPLAE